MIQRNWKNSDHAYNIWHVAHKGMQKIIDCKNKNKKAKNDCQIERMWFFRYIKKLQEAVKGKAPKKDDDEATTAEYHIKIIALKTTSNISTLIRDLFHSPPIFRSVVQLSWIDKKSNVSLVHSVRAFRKATVSVRNDLLKEKISADIRQDKNAGKRHAPITFQADDDAKRQKKNAGGGKNASSSPTSSSEQRLYKTPSGKFSGKVSNYSSNSKARNNNRNGNSYSRNQGKNKSFRKYWAPAPRAREKKKTSRPNDTHTH